jgi:hypothetical protein
MNVLGVGLPGPSTATYSDLLCFNVMLLAEQKFLGSSLKVNMAAEVKFASLHLAQKCCILLVYLFFSFHPESKTEKLGFSSLMKPKGAERPPALLLT